MTSIHFKEDTAKPENRTNLAFFSILQIPEIREFLLLKLRLAPDVIIYPSPNLETEEFALSLRPDFKVLKHFDKDKSDVVGYIEVELGSENQAQLSNYRALVRVPVHSIVGQKQAGGDLSLEEIHEVAGRVQKHYLNTQQFASLELFRRLVDYYVVQANFRSDSKLSALSDKMLESKLVRQIYDYFGEENILMNTSVRTGKVMLNTVKENGFSLRVHSTKTGTQGLSLMSRSGGRPTIVFPSLKKLNQYLPNKQADNVKFARLLASLGASEILQIDTEQRATLPLEIVENNFRPIADWIKTLC
jgi:hypothetical protein